MVPATAFFSPAGRCPLMLIFSGRSASHSVLPAPVARSATANGPNALSTEPGAVVRAFDDRHFTDEIGDPARIGLLVDFGGRRHLHQAALIHHRDAVGDDHRLFLVVGDDDKGRAELALQLHQLELRLGTQFLVERGERLVEQQHARALDQGAGKRHALALAARQLVNFAPAEALQPGEVEHLGDARGDFLASHVLLAQSEGDVAFDREVRKQRVALEHHVHGPPMRRHRHDILSAEKDAPFARRLEAGEHAQQRRLAAAGRAEQREEFALRNFQGKRFDCGDGTEALADRLEADQRCSSACALVCRRRSPSIPRSRRTR